MDQLRNEAVLRLSYRSPESLQVDSRSLKVHSKKQTTQIANSIRAFGMVFPVLTRGDKVEIGLGRLLAAKQLGLPQIPAIDVSHLSDSEVLAFKIADNKLSENSKWDDRFLAEQLKQLSESNLDFSIEVTGFEMGEIDFRIQSLDISTQETPEDDVVGVSVSVPGDIWQMDGHRLYCGNTLDAVSAKIVMAGAKAAMVLADDPYNVPINGHVSGKGKRKFHEFAMATGEMTDEQFVEFLKQSYRVGADHCVDGSLHYRFIDWRHLRAALDAGGEIFDQLINICVWDKMTPGMGSHYRSQHEFVLVFKFGKGRHQNNIQLGKFKRNRSNIWSYPGANSFGFQGDDAAAAKNHPTVKPIQLVADAILDCTKRGDIVLDTYLGSGTTLIAAEKTRRRCYGIEIDPTYVDMAIRRWQRHTGAAAKHALTGKSFCSLERERSDAA